MHQTIPLAKNHVCISPEFFKEASKITESKTYKKSIQRIALVLAIIYIVIGIYLICTKTSIFILLGETVFIGALLFWLAVMLPRTRRRSKYKAMSAGGQSTPERTITFYQDHMVVLSNTGKETSISYDHILSLQETTHLYVISCKENRGIILDKQGFSIGDFQLVQTLIKGTED